jgi:hypothetical protein
MKVTIYFHCGGLQLYPQQKPIFPRNPKPRREE